MGAEDVFQQVMTEMWLRASSFDAERGSFARWLMTLARSRALDELRRRRPEPVDPVDVALHGADDASLQGVIDEWELSYLLTTLPTDERQVIEMRFRDDLSQSEIASRTGLPLGTVKTRMNRGLTRLRTSLTVEEGTQ
jgi:RNA polymerase sigma-70 factor (ECF subfamily)